MNPINSSGAFMAPILRRLAPQLGATLVFEPAHEIVGRIIFPNGNWSYFWHNIFNLNSVASARIAHDKGYTDFFLKKAGFKVPSTGVFLRDAFCTHLGVENGVEAAKAFARRHDWNVYVKPVRGSQGRSIVRTYSQKEFEAASRALLKVEKKILVQEACSGRDYRFVVLDGEVISTYERIHLHVIGDGVRSIRELLEAKHESYKDHGRGEEIDVDDRRIVSRLKRLKMKLETVPAANTIVRLLDVANLSCGGTTRVVSAPLHSSVAKMAVAVAATIGLRFAGVDVLLEDPTEPLGEYRVLEVNSAPGLDHYGDFGAEHELEIDKLYLKVLMALERSPTGAAGGA